MGFSVRTTPDYWQKITEKHPDMADKLDSIRQALAAPIEVRQSNRDANILLFYGSKEVHWPVAVVRRLNGDGFLITAYRTDAIKEGAKIWPR